MLNLSPSLMCADQGYFAEEVKQLEAAGATTFHMDIMDGEFAPNFALSWAQVGYCRKISRVFGFYGGKELINHPSPNS